MSDTDVLDYIRDIQRKGVVDKARSAAAAAGKLVDFKVPIVPGFVDINLGKLLELLKPKG